MESDLFLFGIIEQKTNIIPTKYQQSTNRVPAAAAPQLALPAAHGAAGGAGQAGLSAAAAAIVVFYS